MRQLIFSTLLFTGCATADQVKELNTKVEEMEKKIAELATEVEYDWGDD